MPTSSEAGGFQQIVRPAGTGHEAGWVLVAALLILCGAVLAVNVNREPVADAVIAAHEVDARTGLSAAEQGLFADLRIAAAEISALGRPEPEILMAEGLAPFVPDVSWRNRGSLTWSLTTGGAYLGLSADPAVAGSFLLVMDDHGPDIWLNNSAEAPRSLDHAALAAAGWRRIVSTFVAGVTR